MKEPVVKITLDLHKESVDTAVSLKHGDTGGRIAITLSEGGFPYEITGDCYAVLTAVKPDGNILYNRCEILGNTVFYEVTAQTTALVGRMTAEVKLYGGEDRLITSAAFRILVQEAVCTGEMVESTGEVSALTHLVSQTLDITRRSDELIATAENAVQVVEQAAEHIEAAVQNANEAAHRADQFLPVAQEAEQKAEEAIRNVNTLREVVCSFHSNIVGEENGEVITIADAADMPLTGLKVFGRTKQLTTTGKNLFASQWEQGSIDNITGANYASSGAIRCGYVAVSPLTVYALSRTVTTSYMQVRGYDANKNYIGSGGTVITLVQGSSVGNPMNTGHKSCVIRTNDNIYYLRFADVSNDISTQYQLELGSTVTAYEPYTGGIPAPNPDYPQTLDSVGADGRVDVTVFGKNLLQNTAKTATQNGVTFTVNEDGTITANGTNDSGSSVSCTLSQYKEIPGEWIGKDFIISGGVHADALVEIGFACSDGSSYSVRSTTVENRFTVADNVTHWFASIRVLNGVSLSNAVFRPMLRLASVTDNTYEPYKKQTLSITTPNGLPGIPVASGGNYTDGSGQQWICDEVDFEKGVYVQRVEKRVFTGTEAFRLHASGRYYLDIANGRFAITDTWGLFSNDVSREGGTQFGSSGVYFKTAHSTVDEFKAYLADNYASGQPITAQIVLRTFTETALSAEQLAAFALLHTNCPNTTVFNDKNAGMKVKYVADTKWYIDQKFAELAAVLVNQA